VLVTVVGGFPAIDAVHVHVAVLGEVRAEREREREEVEGWLVNKWPEKKDAVVIFFSGRLTDRSELSYNSRWRRRWILTW